MDTGDLLEFGAFTTRFKREIDELVILVKRDVNYQQGEKDKIKKEIENKFDLVVSKAHFFIRKGVPGAKRLWLKLKFLKFLILRAVKNNQPIARQEEILENLVGRVDRIIMEAEANFARKKILSFSFRSL